MDRFEFAAVVVRIAVATEDAAQVDAALVAVVDPSRLAVVETGLALECRLVACLLAFALHH